MIYVDPFNDSELLDDKITYELELWIWRNEMQAALRAQDQAKVVELWYGTNSKYNVPIN